MSEHWLATEASDSEAGVRAITRVAELERDLEHALVTVGAFRQAIEDIFAKADGSATDDGTIRFYTLPTGPLHKAIGMARGADTGGKFLAQLAAAQADAAALRTQRDTLAEFAEATFAIDALYASGHPVMTPEMKAQWPIVCERAQAVLTALASAADGQQAMGGEG